MALFAKRTALRACSSSGLEKVSNLRRLAKTLGHGTLRLRSRQPVQMRVNISPSRTRCMERGQFSKSHVRRIDLCGRENNNACCRNTRTTRRRGSCSSLLLRREVQGRSNWSFCLIHLFRLLGLPEFNTRTLTVSQTAYRPIRDNQQLRTLSHFGRHGWQLLGVCLTLSVHQNVPIHMHAHDLHSDISHSKS